MSENNEQQRGLIASLMADMPPMAKAILMWFLLLPLAIAISGMLLNVNVGVLIEKTMNQSRGDTIDIVDAMLMEQFATINKRFDKLEKAIVENDRAQARTAEKVNGLDNRVTKVENDVVKIKAYICDKDGKLGYGTCEALQ